MDARLPQASPVKPPRAHRLIGPSSPLSICAAPSSPPPPPPRPPLRERHSSSLHIGADFAHARENPPFTSVAVLHSIRRQSSVDLPQIPSVARADPADTPYSSIASSPSSESMSSQSRSPYWTKMAQHVQQQTAIECRDQDGIVPVDKRASLPGGVQKSDSLAGLTAHEKRRLFELRKLSSSSMNKLSRRSPSHV